MKRLNFNSRPRQGRTALIVVILVAVVAILLAVGFLPKMKEKSLTAKRVEEIKGESRSVKTATVKPASDEESATLPGNIGAMQYASIYSRVDGYLKKRVVDLGDTVKSGQVIAEIETPTIDEELSQSLADLAEAKAQLESARSSLKEAQAQAIAAEAQVKRVVSDQEFAGVTASRWEKMAQAGAVSLQSRDEKNRALLAQNAALESQKAQKAAADESVVAAGSRINVAQATVQAKQAAVNKLRAQQSFKYVRAPFDGVITIRNVDPGALISAGSQSQNQELYQMAKLDVLRIYVDAPQKISKYLAPGGKAEVFVSAFPGKTFIGEISNVSGALNPQTRTRQTEIKIDNYNHLLIPGMYAQVKLTVHRSDKWLRVPSTAVIPKGDDLEVVLLKNGKAQFQKVVLGRDFGDELEIKAGLNEGDIVIVNPPDDLFDGDPVTTGSTG